MLNKNNDQAANSLFLSWNVFLLEHLEDHVLELLVDTSKYEYANEAKLLRNFSCLSSVCVCVCVCVGGGGYSAKFFYALKGPLQPLTLLNIPFLTEKVPLWYTFYWYPFHIPSLELYIHTFFLFEVLYSKKYINYNSK